MITIMHPIGGHINFSLQRGHYEYEIVHTVETDDLNVAFRLSQNDFSEEYCSLDRRSTCVGDILHDIPSNEYYFVAPRGFINIPHTVASYIDWGNHMNISSDIDTSNCVVAMSI
jgi:hypothetical protein